MALATPATALWNQRAVVAARQDELRQLIAAVGRPTDLCLHQWTQLMAFALEFQPDVILELGRGWGNSTCCFLETAALLGHVKPCKVVSLSLDEHWQQRTVPRLQKLRPPDWFARGEMLQQDIVRYDAAPMLRGAQRCFVFWDAHGFPVAEWVLGHLLPQLAARPHAVALHDMSDRRFCTPPRDYRECGMWKGENGEEAGFNFGHIFSRVSQAISAVDFAARNQMPLHSADESYFAELGDCPKKFAELKHLLGDDGFSLNGHWFWFTLDEAREELTFPTFGTAFSPPVPAASMAPRPPLWKRALGRSRRYARQAMNRCLALGDALTPVPPPVMAVPELAAPSFAPPNRSESDAPSPPREVWLDVGAHLGEKTFAAARANPNLIVYAFEPNWRMAAQLQGRLPNYIVFPCAVAEADGSAGFHRNRYSEASSLLPLNPAGVQEWRDGGLLHVEQTLTVPTVRLDTFLALMQIPKVDYLKIDAQGADLGVVRSLGLRIADVERIDLEVQTTATPLYQGAAEKTQVLALMEQAGFTLCATELQSHGQEENLTFARTSLRPRAIARPPSALDADSSPPDTDCFDTPEAWALNEARLDHLESLGLDLRFQRVLDVGCGVGHLGSHLAEYGCRVVCVDGREGNIRALRQRYPHMEAHVADVECDALSRFGRFDAVLCYGLLYHLENPVAALRNIAGACGGLLLVESVTADHPDPVLVAVDEPPSANQALQRLGCRPSPAYLVKALRHVGFPWVYAPRQAPAHPDFDFLKQDNLEHQRDGHLLRCMLVASRQPLANANLRLIMAVDEGAVAADPAAKELQLSR